MSYFNLICYSWSSIAVLVFFTLLFVTAPYGRHTTTKWGPMIDNKTGWILMELPSLLIMIYFFIYGKNTHIPYVSFLFILWILHYINRTLIFPFRLKTNNKKMPVFIVINAIVFNLMNAGLNGFYLGELSETKYLGMNWFYSIPFYIGIVLFITGVYINISSDNILIRLRKENETDYKIPQGGLFDQLSSPNLFGEIIEWLGFAIMAWNLPALTFLIWTLANLVPRAISHYHWNVKNIKDYPANRKIIFPYLY